LLKLKLLTATMLGRSLYSIKLEDEQAQEEEKRWQRELELQQEQQQRDLEQLTQEQRQRQHSRDQSTTSAASSPTSRTDLNEPKALCTKKERNERGCSSWLFDSDEDSEEDSESDEEPPLVITAENVARKAKQKSTQYVFEADGMRIAYVGLRDAVDAAWEWCEHHGHTHNSENYCNWYGWDYNAQGEVVEVALKNEWIGCLTQEDREVFYEVFLDCEQLRDGGVTLGPIKLSRVQRVEGEHLWRFDEDETEHARLMQGQADAHAAAMQEKDKVIAMLHARLAAEVEVTDVDAGTSTSPAAADYTDQPAKRRRLTDESGAHTARELSRKVDVKLEDLDDDDDDDDDDDTSSDDERRGRPTRRLRRTAAVHEAAARKRAEPFEHDRRSIHRATRKVNKQLNVHLRKQTRKRAARCFRRYGSSVSVGRSSWVSAVKHSRGKYFVE
jgi:hypothetical protein